MQSGCRSRYGAFDFAENGLIVRGVALFRFAVEVWRNGNLSCRADYLAETYVGTVPAEFDHRRRVGAACAFGRQHYFAFSVDFDAAVKRSFFPLFGVSYQALP